MKRYASCQQSVTADRIKAKENSGIATMVRALGRCPAGHFYIDHLENAQGKSIVAVFSARARVGFNVSALFDWYKVKPGLKPRQIALHNRPARMQKKTIYSKTYSNGPGIRTGR